MKIAARLWTTLKDFTVVAHMAFPENPVQTNKVISVQQLSNPNTLYDAIKLSSQGVGVFSGDGSRDMNRVLALRGQRSLGWAVSDESQRFYVDGVEMMSTSYSQA